MKTKTGKRKHKAVTITVLVPAGVQVKEVIGVGPRGVLEKLEIVS